MRHHMVRTSRLSPRSDEDTKRIKELKRKRTLIWSTLATASTLALSLLTIITLRWDRHLLSVSVFESIVFLSAGISCICGCLRDDRFLLLPFMFLVVLLIVIRFIVVILALIAALFPDNYKEILKDSNPRKKHLIGDESLRIALFIISVGSAILVVVLYLTLIRSVTYYMMLREEIERDLLIEMGRLLLRSDSTKEHPPNSGPPAHPSSQSGSDEHSTTASSQASAKSCSRSTSSKTPHSDKTQTDSVRPNPTQNNRISASQLPMNPMTPETTTK